MSWLLTSTPWALVLSILLLVLREVARAIRISIAGETVIRVQTATGQPVEESARAIAEVLHAERPNSTLATLPGVHRNKRKGQ